MRDKPDGAVSEGQAVSPGTTRRVFLQVAGKTMVVLTLIPMACGDEVLEPVACTGVASSATSAGHTHSMCVSQADLDSPPAGGRTYATSLSEGHTHTVTLTAEQLASIAGGGTVQVTSSNDSGHTHPFTIVG